MAEKYDVDLGSVPGEKVSGKRKSALLLIALGPDVSAKVLKRLDSKNIEEVTQEIASIGFVDAKNRRGIFNAFKNTIKEHGILSEGGMSYLKEILEKAVGPQRANELIRKISLNKERVPFDLLREIEPGQIFNFIQNEHPQTIALILSYLRPEQSSVILSQLLPEKQVEVVKRIATMSQTAPDVLQEIERVLRKKISSFTSGEVSRAGGVKAVAEVLNRADRATEKSILEALDEENPEIADEIKKLMFVFEDVILIDDRGIQQILKEVDNRELALALKTSSDELKEKIFKNMSKRAGEALREEMEYLGPVRLKNVEEAQQNIVAIVRRLEEAGEIIVAGRGGKGDEIIV
ncbi:MAG: flagellar motor switch protein FliG [Candidatus Omnitrophica bacterium]|nr:flagellar motor switch protein FliG [Candidatus Omnitrophota bacterium]